MARAKKSSTPNHAESYSYPEADSPLRPDVGTQPNFPKKKRKQPKEYRYDSSLSPALEWDDNPAREQAEALIATILAAESLEEAKAAAAKLKALGQPFLNWAGKAERLSFEVPTLPLFVHERLSTKAIIETLKGHKKGGDQLSLFDLFADPQNSIVDQALKAYEHRDKWVNRMILGDSLQVMNSLLEYEGLGGQVQMIYVDPPYGVKFGSNFQPFVRKRDVKHNDDEDMTREPEMVQAYRDTWELGLHSYLAYLRDRLLVARELLKETGSIFVQISDENLHHIRELMDEVFGKENFVGLISFQKKGSQSGDFLPPIHEYLIWFGKNKEYTKFHPLYVPRDLSGVGGSGFNYVELEDGEVRTLTAEELLKPNLIEGKVFRYNPLFSSKSGPNEPVLINGKKYPSGGNSWKVSTKSIPKLYEMGRVISQESRLVFKRYANDFNYVLINPVWMDLGGAPDKSYVVQTNTKVIQRCLLMTTDPGEGTSKNRKNSVSP